MVACNRRESNCTGILLLQDYASSICVLLGILFELVSYVNLSKFDRILSRAVSSNVPANSDEAKFRRGEK